MTIKIITKADVKELIKKYTHENYKDIYGELDKLREEIRLINDELGCLKK